jgi:hypothetical protein
MILLICLIAGNALAGEAKRSKFWTCSGLIVQLLIWPTLVLDILAMAQIQWVQRYLSRQPALGNNVRGTT